MKRLNTYCEIIAALLILLWVYTFVSKIVDFQLFLFQMSIQPFPKALSNTVAYAVLTAELVAAVLLSFPKSRVAGFLFSSILMLLFTGYVALILSGYFPKTPCACGGVLSALGWKSHFFFNLFWTVLAITGSSLEHQRVHLEERRTNNIS